MNDISRQVAEFYRLVDHSYLAAKGKQLPDLEEQLEGVLSKFTEEFRLDNSFEKEARREVVCRLLIFSIDNDLGTKVCLEKWRQLNQLEFDDSVRYWLILCQVSRYFRRYREEAGFLKTLIDVRSDLLCELKGIEETIGQVSAEIDFWTATRQSEMNDDKEQD